MDEDERIDLSALDPARGDEARWHALADAIASRALEARRRAEASPMVLQLFAWARPALALAAGIALVVWTVALTAGGGAGSGAGTHTTTAQLEPAVALSEWAQNDELPATADVLRVLGGDHDEP